MIFLVSWMRKLRLIKSRNLPGRSMQWDLEICLRSPSVQFSSVAQSRPTLQPHGLQHTRPLCPSPTPGACSELCPSSRWCHPTDSFSISPFSSCLQSFPASGAFPMTQFSASGSQSIGASASASVLPVNIQDWFPKPLSAPWKWDRNRWCGAEGGEGREKEGENEISGGEEASLGCRGPAPVDPGNSKRGRRWRDQKTTA